ncbi:MAG: glycosyltransferase family 39 protein, partial [Acidobacteria bacterium]|nr:glycosyltransferase family 39 protein [Acidobacteriota bacterium]
QEPAWHALGTDDAYISYRYARNLAEGFGPVYNAGSRVEGYSIPLHVLLLAPLWRLVGDDGIYAASVVVNIGCLMALAVILGLASAGRRSPKHANATLILLAFCPVLWMTAAMGMETPLVLLLQVLFWWQVQKAGDEEDPGRSRGLPWVAMTALLVLSRADGFLMPAAAVVWLLFRRRRRAAMWVAGASGLHGPSHRLAPGLLRQSAAQHLLCEGLGPSPGAAGGRAPVPGGDRRG